MQQTHGVGFRESLDLLARRAGVDLGPSVSRPTRAQRLDAIRSQAAAYCHQLLVSDDSAAAARAYLRGAHGYRTDDVRTFHMGWAPPDPTVVPDHLGSVGVSEPDMVAAGVARRGPNRPFSRHLGRVLYPVVTGPQRVSGFAAEDRNGGMEHPRHGGRARIHRRGRGAFDLDRYGGAWRPRLAVAAWQRWCTAACRGSHWPA